MRHIYFLVVVVTLSTHWYKYGLAFSSSKPSSSITRRRRTGILLAAGDSSSDNINSEVSDYSFRDSWCLVTVGDLHMEDDMSYHQQAQRDCLHALEDFPLLGAPTDAHHSSSLPLSSSMELNNDIVQSICEKPGGDLTEEELGILLAQKSNSYLNSHLVSLGDLGRKNIIHEQGDAGTTKSFVDAKTFFDGFGGIDYDLVTGNHDLEGLDEFDTDQENLQAWMDCYKKPTPYFSRTIGERTLLLGLSTGRFRDAPYSSHEVHVDDEQIEWFREMVESHPASDGWKILVFSHAPIIGSGLRVLQSVHVTNGCAWLNHCSPPDVRNSFVRIVKDNPQIKCWFSGHFHLSHDYEDALVQAVKGSPCAFLQVGVMGPGSSRDNKRQTRFVRGCGGDFLQLFSINHHERVPVTNLKRDEVGDATKARVRLDATLDLRTGEMTYAQEKYEGEDGNDCVDDSKADWFQAYVPQEEDGCYLQDIEGSVFDDSRKVCWWHMSDGKVLGLHQEQLVEYDSETLSPLGVVLTKEQLASSATENGTKEVLVVQNKSILVLVDDETREMEVIHPNEDGSYWRKFQRNKKIRLEEKAREEIARRWLEQNIVSKNIDNDEK